MAVCVATLPEHAMLFLTFKQPRDNFHRITGGNFSHGRVLGNSPEDVHTYRPTHYSLLITLFLSRINKDYLGFPHAHTYTHTDIV